MLFQIQLYIISYFTIFLIMSFFIVNFLNKSLFHYSSPLIINYITKYSRVKFIFFFFFIILSGLPPFIFFFYKFNFLISLCYELPVIYLIFIFLIFICSMIFYLQFFYFKNTKLIFPLKLQYKKKNYNNIYYIIFIYFIIFLSIFFYIDICYSLFFLY